VVKESALRGRGAGFYWFEVELYARQFPGQSISYATPTKGSLLQRIGKSCNSTHIVIEGMIIAAYAMGTQVDTTISMAIFKS
jgi:NADH:ubiquinone oxidoreductase subunit F (NADH-binding)